MPVSAKAGDQVQLLEDLLVGLLPEGPQLYPDGDLTDAPEEIIVAELIREAALEGVRDELPHSIAVVVEEMRLREGRPEDRPLLDIHANLYVERDSQKGIVIGHKGARLKDVGTAARKQIEALLGTPVYLDLHVKIAKDWQRDPRAAAQAGLLRTDLRRLPPGPDRRALATRPTLGELVADDAVFRSPAVAHAPRRSEVDPAPAVAVGSWAHGDWQIGSYAERRAVRRFDADLAGPVP